MDMREMNFTGRHYFTTAGFWVTTVLLVLMIAFSVTGTVMAMSKGNDRSPEICYREQEQIMVEAIREYLYQEGFRNSGVNLISVVDSDGNRSYQVSIHHGKIDRLTEEGREQLLSELHRCGFAADDSNLNYQFF